MEHTSKRKMAVWAAFALITAALMPLAAGAGPGRLVLRSEAMNELTALLSAGDGLHTALIRQDEEQVEVALRDLETANRRVIARSSALREHERTHLMKILDLIDEQVGVARNSGHTERRMRLFDIFGNLANLVRIYAVDSRFKIFFCSRDKLTWIQVKPRGQYPFVDGAERSPSSECALRAD